MRSGLRRGARAGWCWCGLLLAASALAAEPAGTAATGPANLLQAINDALLSSPLLQSAQAEFDAAKQFEPEAKARLYPQLSLFGSADWVRDGVEGDYYGIVSIDRSDTYERFIYGATLRQSVYNGQLWSNLDQAGQRLARARAEAERKREGVMLGVCDAYFAVLAAGDRRRIAGAKLESFRQQARQVEGRSIAGLALDAELKSAQAGVDLAQAALLEAESQVEAAHALLETYTGRRYVLLLPLPAKVTLASPKPADQDSWVQRAREGNLSVAVREREVDIAKLELQRLRRSRWPQLDLVGSAYEIDNGGGISGERDESDQRIGLAATLPLYSGGRVSAEIERGLQQQKRAEAEVELARRQAEREAKLAWLNTSSGARRIQALQKAVAAAIAAEDANRAGYEVGTRTNAEVLDAVEQRYEAETNLSGARYKLLVDSLHLKSAAGALLNADLAQVNRLLRAEPAGTIP
ncbi:MAG: TolC family outer membrane protein [Stagnimonas sp.]|nr:TolC family outer membrane protein [Stagnimonas sp.]